MKVSTSRPEARLENPEIIVLEINNEIDLTDTPTSQTKRHLSIPTVVGTLSTPSLPEVKVSAL
jgi:hypothetical protein